MPNIKPRYEVHKLPGTATRIFCDIRADDKGKNLGGFDFTEKEVDAGFMVYLPNGSSFRCWDQDELEKLDLNEPARLIDMESGDDMGTSSVGSLKTNSERKTSRGRSGLPGLAATEGIS